ncbi:hypothetical protein LCGC14_1182340 [marine sediment metagenome]|uniref:Uncharacterized protein n=1 Tax=marine sediment metagenome TaxID=412755 RepID=A0A0F9P4L4_9ZZZZ
MEKAKTERVVLTVFKTKLPKAIYDRDFARGKKAAEDGWERKSPYNGGRGDVPWFEGFDSVHEKTS